MLHPTLHSRPRLASFPPRYNSEVRSTRILYTNDSPSFILLIHCGVCSSAYFACRSSERIACMAPNEVSDPARRNLNALGIVERTGSVFSLIGCLFIIVTFCCSKAFHKPINRLVFYASFGNGIVNIATLMATSYVGSPNSVGCQTQAFLIQM